VDAHVHLYGVYDLGVVFRSALAGLAAVSGGSGAGAEGHTLVRALCLAERSDCRFFRRLREGDLRPPAGMEIEFPEQDGAWIEAGDAGRLAVAAGRQIVTRERLELLCLGADADIADGVAFRDAARAAREAGGVPVLPWSPGKWWGRRAGEVERVLAEMSPADLLIGDTTLRPLGWGEPLLMARARRRGFRIAAGSDPLPFAGEECRVGSYAVAIEGEAFDASRPATELRRLLRGPAAGCVRVGRRGSPVSVALRLLRNRSARRAGGGGGA
jgi:hypothetical protein